MADLLMANNDNDDGDQRERVHDFHEPEEKRDADLLLGWRNEPLPPKNDNVEEQLQHDTVAGLPEDSDSLLNNNQQVSPNDGHQRSQTTAVAKRRVGPVRRMLAERRVRLEQQQNMRQIQSFTFENAHIEFADTQEGEQHQAQQQQQQQQLQKGYKDNIQEEYIDHVENLRNSNENQEDDDAPMQPNEEPSEEGVASQRPVLNWIRKRASNKIQKQQQENEELLPLERGNQETTSSGTIDGNARQIDDNFASQRPVLNWIRKRVVSSQTEGRNSSKTKDENQELLLFGGGQREGEDHNAPEDHQESVAVAREEGKIDRPLTLQKEGEDRKEIQFDTSCIQSDEEETDQEKCMNDNNNNNNKSSIDIVGPTRVDKPMEGFGASQRPVMNWMRNRTKSQKGGGERKGLLGRDVKKSVLEQEMDSKSFKSMSMADSTRNKEKVDTVCIWHDPTTGKSWL